jgi:hypothetical protein
MLTDRKGPKKDLKSLDGNVVWVRVPPPAPKLAGPSVLTIGNKSPGMTVCFKHLDDAGGTQVPDNPAVPVALDAPDLTRRRAIFRIALATAGAATAMYVAPVVVRIDEAEAKGSKRRGGSKRWKWPSKRRRRRFPSRRRW